MPKRTSKIAVFLRQKLVKHPSLHEVSYAACVPYPWLRALTEGKILSPSCDRAERVYQALTGKPIAL